MKKEKGQIKVTVQTQDRLRAIISLSSAIDKVASALTTPIIVEIYDCHLECHDKTDGVIIDTADRVTKTEIVNYEN